MAAWQRIVSATPLERLFTSGGLTDHVRGDSLSSEQIETLLRSSADLCLCEAVIGSPLRWHHRGDYGFWLRHAKALLADPGNSRPLEDFSGERCYFASLWTDPATADRVILFEEYH